MSPRATPLPPAARRAAIIAAARPLIAAHGTHVTTKQIAEASGIAEGTLFRVFDDKIELMIAVIESLTDPTELCAQIRELHEGTLAVQAKAVLVAVQTSYTELSHIYATLFTLSPIEAGDRMRTRQPQWDQQRQWQRELNESVQAALQPFESDLSAPLPRTAALLVGMATISSHGLIRDGNLSDPDDIVELLLHGIQRADSAAIDSPHLHGTQRKAAQ